MRVDCPKCATALEVNTVAAVGEDQRFTYCIWPQEADRPMQAELIGKQLVALDATMKAIAKQDGGKVRTYIERIETGEQNQLIFHLAVLDVVRLKDTRP